MGILRVMLRPKPDGILARHLAGLAFFTGEGVPTVADFSLNATNELTVEWLRKLGAMRVTASYDLNRDRLADLVAAVQAEWLEVVVHQHMPMFHMEHCVFCAVLSPGTNKHNCGRPCDVHEVKLRDRVGMEHTLAADVGCRNTLYNATAQERGGGRARAVAAGRAAFSRRVFAAGRGRGSRTDGRFVSPTPGRPFEWHASLDRAARGEPIGRDARHDGRTSQPVGDPMTDRSESSVTQPTLVVGSANRKKAAEIVELLAPLGLRVLTLADYPPAAEIEGTGTTFIENVTIKAVENAARLGEWVLADDSGLEVNALDGRPGVYSAVYAGPKATDEANRELLLRELAGIPLARRGGSLCVTWHWPIRRERFARGPKGLAAAGSWPRTWAQMALATIRCSRSSNTIARLANCRRW